MRLLSLFEHKALHSAKFWAPLTHLFLRSLTSQTQEEWWRHSEITHLDLVHSLHCDSSTTANFKTFISCYRTPGPWNWFLSPGKPNASSIVTPSWKVFEGFLKAFGRGFEGLFSWQVRGPFKIPSTTEETPEETPSETLQKSFWGPGSWGMKVLMLIHIPSGRKLLQIQFSKQLVQ